MVEELAALREARLADTDLIFDVHHALSAAGALQPGQSLLEGIRLLLDERRATERMNQINEHALSAAEGQMLVIEEALSAAGIDYGDQSMAEVVAALIAERKAAVKPKATRKPRKPRGKSSKADKVVVMETERASSQ